jgi:hypothetical protein
MPLAPDRFSALLERRTGAPGPAHALMLEQVGPAFDDRCRKPQRDRPRTST